ncbi:MAG: hypothetical protein COT73_07080 [Bdellovibrio sp. CG10_big_fil_rev_8_21_14_0_10_47_8]|nr:MAG: hypothetical protein COT73_07080 [Bdellovibrio sp. CG10_big_fil_rev_8_21_14_0_10_47_8]
MKKYELEVNNLIVHFGKAELLESFMERVWPIFDMELDSHRGETYQYKFLQVNVAKIDDDYFVFGRLMQRMNLKARQRLSKNNHLVLTNDELQSDPTSIFLIRLYDHKLFVIPEQPRSPRSKTFKYVISKLLNEAHLNLYLKERAEFLRSKGVQRFSKDLRQQFEKEFDDKWPEPEVALNPIGSKAAVEEILDVFEIVKSLRLEYHKTNNEDYELDEELISKFGQSVNRTNSDKALQEYRNNKDGLNFESVENLVKASTQTGGNCNFKMTGVSSTGETVTRTEEHTKITPKIEAESDWSIERFGKVAAKRLADLIEDGQIKLATIVNVEESKELAKKIFNTLRNR